MNIPNNKIIVILGPTASGKSDLAIELARQFDGEIISADSRQVYRGMDIGTGKVTEEEQRLAKHWMLDIVSPNTDYNVAKYKKQAQKIIEDILLRGKLPIICGGTGFWIKALVDNVDFPQVKPDPVLRNKLRNKSAEDLFQELKQLDPERASNIDHKNKVRLIRAIEICNALGRVPRYKIQDTRYKFLQIGIDIPKDKLDKRIKIRLEKRFEQGMIEEVKNLHEGKQTYIIHNTKYIIPKISWKRLEGFGLEYYWIAKYLQKKISRGELNEKLYFDIIHYAKRQMTWFRKDKRIIWLKGYAEIKSSTKQFIKD